MVTINNEDLRDIYHYLATIDNILQKEIRQIKGNKHRIQVSDTLNYKNDDFKRLEV